MRVAQWVGGGLLLLWCVIAAVSGLLAAVRQPRDPTADIQAAFLPLQFELPARGQIGYLEGSGSEDETRTYYVAQYTLVPRVLISRVGPEFLIVPNGAERPGGDERLDGYYPVTQLPGGHRLFRRLVPGQGAAPGGSR